MMNRRGTVVLRDVMFMMIIVSSIFVLSGFFIEDMASSYENSNMSAEWSAGNINITGNIMFNDTNKNVTDVADGLTEEATGIKALISSVANALEGLGNGIMMVIFAPTTISNLAKVTLIQIKVPSFIATAVSVIMQIVLYVIVIFSIFTAFSRGSKI